MSYYDLFYIIVLILAAGAGVLIGMSRRTFRSMVSCISTVVAALIALVFTYFSIRIFISTGLSSVATVLNIPWRVRALINGNDGLTALLTIFIGGFFGPTVLCISFVVIKLLLLIPSLIIKSRIKKNESDEYRKGAVPKLFGALMGMLSAVLIAFFVLFPVSSAVSMVSEVFSGLSSESLNVLYEDFPGLYETRKITKFNSSERPVCSYGTREITAVLGSAEYKNQKNNIDDAIRSGTKGFDALVRLAEAEDLNFSEEGNVKKYTESLDSLIEAVTDNKLFYAVTVDFTSDICDELTKTGNYIDIIELPEDIESWQRRLIAMFATIGNNAGTLFSSGEKDFEEEIDKYHQITDELGKLILSVSGNLEGDDVLNRLDAEALGNIVEIFNSTILFKGQSEELIEIIFEIDSVKEAIPEADKLKASLIAALEKGDGSFAKTLEASKRAAVIALELTKHNVNKEEIANQIGWLVDNMDENLSETVKSAVSSSAFAGNMNAQTASALSDAVENLCDKLAVKKEIDEDSSKQESEALVTLYNIGTEIGKSKESIFGDKIEGADKVVSSICNSEIISEVVMDMNYTEGSSELKAQPLGVDAKLSESDKAQLTDALDSYKAANENTDPKLLSAIGNLFGITY